MSARTKTIGPPRLTLSNGTPATHRTVLLPDDKRKATRDVMSGCTVDPHGLSVDGNLGFIRELRAEHEQGRRESWLSRAIECDAKAKKARGMHIKRMRDDADFCRRYALKDCDYVPLPVAKGGEGKDAYRPYAIVSATYADTIAWTIYDPAGRVIVSASVTGPVEAQALAIGQLEQIGDGLKAAATRPTFTLVRGKS